MKFILPLIALFFLFGGQKQRIALKTNSGDSIIVSESSIFFNQKPIYHGIEGIVYESKYNRLIEQDSKILLFLEIDESPNFNRITAFEVTAKEAIKLAECVYNDKSQRKGPAPFTDMDNDGWLEFGGFDLTEMHPDKDSMYYIPSEYYEISHGKVTYDSSLTKAMDIKENGIYLPHPLDKEGNCCIVIKKPASKSLH